MLSYAPLASASAVCNGLDLSPVINEEVSTLDPLRGRWISVRAKNVARQLKRLDYDDRLRILHEDTTVYPLRQFRKADDALRQNYLNVESAREIDNDILFPQNNVRLITVLRHRSKDADHPL